MRNPIWQTLFPIVAAVLLVSCSGDGGTDDRSNAVAKPARSDTACQALHFDDVEQFTANDYLFFGFEHPKGWLHKPATDGMAGHGFVHAPGNERIQIEYVVFGIPMPPNYITATTHARESQMVRLNPLTYGDVEVQPYGKSFPRKATLGLILPNGDDVYDISFAFHGPKDCDAALFEGLRTTVLESIVPNPSSNFDQTQTSFDTR